jgi:hypothetical protein
MRYASHGFTREWHDFVFAQKPGVGTAYSVDLPALVECGERGCSNDGVETRRVAAAGIDGNTLWHGSNPWTVPWRCRIMNIQFRMSNDKGRWSGRDISREVTA